MNRRQFLKNMAALAAVPGIIKAENAMKIWVPPEPIIILPDNAFERMTWTSNQQTITFTNGADGRIVASTPYPIDDPRLIWADNAGRIMTENINSRMYAQIERQLQDEFMATGRVELHTRWVKVA